MHAELELGRYGMTGLGIGSPPRTPQDERAMSGWVGVAPPSRGALEAAREEERKATVPTGQSDWSRDELFDWLIQPVQRTEFESVADILEAHGVKGEFMRPPADDDATVTEASLDASLEHAQGAPRGRTPRRTSLEAILEAGGQGDMDGRSSGASRRSSRTVSRASRRSTGNSPKPPATPRRTSAYE